MAEYKHDGNFIMPQHEEIAITSALAQKLDDIAELENKPIKNVIDKQKYVEDNAQEKNIQNKEFDYCKNIRQFFKPALCE